MFNRPVRSVVFNAESVGRAGDCACLVAQSNYLLSSPRRVWDGGVVAAVREMDNREREQPGGQVADMGWDRSDEFLTAAEARLLSCIAQSNSDSGSQPQRGDSVAGSSSVFYQSAAALHLPGCDLQSLLP